MLNFIPVVFNILLLLLNTCRFVHPIELDLYSRHEQPQGYYNNLQNSQPGITNLTTLVGKTVLFNCTLSPHGAGNMAERSVPSFSFKSRMNPTWLKADALYDRVGCIKGYGTENIIVTRKGIIAGTDFNKMKLIGSYNGQFQSLQISNVNINNEGKYVCREFNSIHDKLFHLSVYARVSGLNLKLEAPGNYLRNSYISRSDHLLGPHRTVPDENDILEHENIHFDNNYDNSVSSSSISIKENEVLNINCTVDVSKPAANISIWLVPNHRLISDKNSKQIKLFKSYTVQNADLTMKTIAVAKLTVTRYDNQKSVICIAENTALNEKWESKKTLNVLYAPLCSPYQKKTYYTGINQTAELECRMTDANPQYLNFKWQFANNQIHRDVSQSNGFISRVKFTPKSKSDFGQIKCIANNGLDSGECQMQLALGGPPNPPHACYHKENNKTIIIECLPGFEQGDPEVYFYLLKRKSNDVLVEYARKRDSCSFLISNLILEEHLNEFFVYSSNKYGNNREEATKIVIENKEFLAKASKKLQIEKDEKSKQQRLMGAAIVAGVIFFGLFCFMLIRCHNSNIKMKAYSTASRATLPQPNHLDGYGDGFKYSSHQTHYQSKSGVFIDNYVQEKKPYKDKYKHNNDTSSSDLDQEQFSSTYDRAKLYEKSNSKQKYGPSLLNNIQDLDMSPKSKRLSLKEKVHIDSGCSRSFTEETETDSDNNYNYKMDDFSNQVSLNEDHKLNLYSPIKNNTINNTLKMNDNSHHHNRNIPNPHSYHQSSNQRSSMKQTVWYGNHTDDFGAMDRTMFNLERGFAINSNMNSTIEKLGVRATYSFGSELSQDNNIYGDRDRDMDRDGTNDYKTYQDLIKDDYDQDREEKSLFQWPQTELPQLYSNETISLDIDDDKIVGILV